MAHDVFISYSTQDKSIADAVCATLEQNGIRCWIAPRDILPGREYADALVEALHGSRLLVLVFSSGANASVQVRQEVERAVSHGLIVLPFRIEDVPPNHAMELFIGGRHWLDALTPPLEAHLNELARTVKALLARSADEHAAAASAAPPWTPPPRPAMAAPPAPAAAVPNWARMSEPQALKHLRNAWIAGLVSAGITLVFTLAALSSGEQLIEGMELNWTSVIDVILLIGLSFGTYKRLRWCAAGLLIDFVVSKLVQWSAAGPGNAVAMAFTVLFLYLFVQGVRGAWAWHGLRPGAAAVAA